MKTKIVSIRGDDSAMEITFCDGPSNWWDRLWRRKPAEWKVRGSFTTWFHFPSGDRCSLKLETKLLNIWMNRENIILAMLSGTE